MVSVEEAVTFNRRAFLAAAATAGGVSHAGHKLAFDQGTAWSQEAS